MQKIIATITLCIALTVPHISYSNETDINKNGYKTRVYWFKKGKELRVSGEVKGKNKKCESLNMRIYLSNNKTHRTVKLLTRIEDYRGNKSNSFWANKNIHNGSGHTSDWYVENIYYTCLN